MMRMMISPAMSKPLKLLIIDYFCKFHIMSDTLVDMSGETLIDIVAFFGKAPHELHKIIHLMRVSQQILVDLMIQHNRKVLGTGMRVEPTSYDPTDNEWGVYQNSDHQLILSYSITDDPLETGELDEVSTFLQRVIRIDDDFAHVSIDDLKSLDLTNSGFM